MLIALRLHYKNIVITSQKHSFQNREIASLSKNLISITFKLDTFISQSLILQQLTDLYI